MTASKAASHRGRSLAWRHPSLVWWEIPLVVLADVLFWDHPVGLSLPLYGAVLGGSIVVSRPGAWRDLHRRAAAIVLLAAGLLPMVEDLSALSLLFGLLAIALSIECGMSVETASGWAFLRRAVARLTSGPRRLTGDIGRRRHLVKRRRTRAPLHPAVLIAWVLPLGLFGVFLALFAAANPVIAGWLAAIPLLSWPDVSTALRVLFWLLITVAIWPILRARRSRRRTPPPAASRADMRRLPGAPQFAQAVLTPAAILRSLLLVNGLFALQGALDGAFLWGGVSLPDGMSYATYAHRGAYPLVATALLAGCFVLLARRATGSRSIEVLALLFIGQNLLLMISAMRRLSLYVEVYSLTQWRVAAFVWMVLVAIGLALMMAQIFGCRDNGWLLTRVALATAVVLYGCCFIDTASVIASYNVVHCAEGEGSALDLNTLMSLGPAAIPAVDRYLVGNNAPEWQRSDLEAWRANAAGTAQAKAADWRAWSFRMWRLARYLDTNPALKPLAMFPEPTHEGDPQSR